MGATRGTERRTRTLWRLAAVVSAFLLLGGPASRAWSLVEQPQHSSGVVVHRPAPAVVVPAARLAGSSHATVSIDVALPPDGSLSAGAAIVDALRASSPTPRSAAAHASGARAPPLTG